MPPFWTPLRAPFWTPRQAETGLLGGLGPSKSRFQLVFLGPGGFQERSKRPTGAENKRPEDRIIAKRLPRSLQEGFKTHFGAILGRILEPSRDEFGTIRGPVGELFLCTFQLQTSSRTHKAHDKNRSIAISITSSKRPSGNPAASTQGAAQQQQPSSSTQGAAQEQQEPSS